MTCLVIFDKIEPTLSASEMTYLAMDLAKAAKSTSLLKYSQITVKTVIGKLVNIPTFAKVAILLPIESEDKKVNSGEDIHNFKKNAISAFAKYNIILDSNSLFTKLVMSDEIQKITDEIDRASKEKAQEKDSVNEEFDYEQKSKQYVPVEPLYSFNRVILPQGVIEKIEEAIAVLECEKKVFEEWGLYEIQPHPSTSLSFFGPPGTGKTMAAEAVAEKLGKKILKVSYTDVESKYHGEGPKMIKAIFLAAKNEDAVLFFDEADSLLSKRLTNVTEGSAQAINSMRSQLLISLEEFRGIVIFATNLVINYDQAFLTRLISVEFPLPDKETRKKIWDVHIKAPNDGQKHKINIPLGSDVDTSALAEKYDFVGREIRNAVIGACVRAALKHKDIIHQQDFIDACDNIQKERQALAEAKDHTKDKTGLPDFLREAILKKADTKEGKEQNVSESSKQ